jgi:HEPN domain-containing protein
MTDEEKVRYWIDLSEKDSIAAQVMMNAGLYLYAGFMCHQMIEKIFKGYFAKIKGSIPPFIHDLERLAKKSELYGMLNKEQIMLIKELNPLNIEARYPDYKKQLAKDLTRDKTQSILKQAKELQQWTKEKTL